MTPLDLVKLSPLMMRTRGAPAVKVGLIDGPVALDHPELGGQPIRVLSGNGACSIADSTACLHGTFVAGILTGQRGSTAPAICPDCTLLVRPIFTESAASNGEMPSASPAELARAITDCVMAGARVLNMSAALALASIQAERALEEALDLAARRGAIVVVAAGNQTRLGSTALTRHPWVLPVAAYGLDGQPLETTNLGNSIGRQGLGAPGVGVTSLGSSGKPLALQGTSAAAPFVTGALALLWSEFPDVSATGLKTALTQAHSHRRSSVVPPLLDAWAAFQYLRTVNAR
ncbi:MAG: S8 family serine peptidase [Candidatus Hydrogenedentes bacterium]|nr:S8 family serine peptidase [Candidatus Hydrogenedentota bacterium]